MQSIQNLNCPSCGATLQLDADRSEAHCEYCGTRFLVEDSGTGLSVRVVEQVGDLVAASTERTIERVTDEGQQIRMHLEKLDLRQERLQLTQRLSDTRQNLGKAEGELRALLRMRRKSRPAKQRIRAVQRRFLPQLRAEIDRLRRDVAAVDTALNPMPKPIPMP